MKGSYANFYVHNLMIEIDIGEMHFSLLVRHLNRKLLQWFLNRSKVKGFQIII